MENLIQGKSILKKKLRVEGRGFRIFIKTIFLTRSRALFKIVTNTVTNAANIVVICVSHNMVTGKLQSF